MNAIETDGLTRDFGAVRALDGLKLRVKQGSIFGYLGPNGAGKTTTLHLLLGILKPTAGSAQVAGFDVATQAADVRRKCGVLLEFNGLYERLSAYDNLEFHARIQGLTPEDRKARIKELLEGMGLWERRDDRLGSWSRGMKQRLAISRALLHRPPVIFLDEPTAGFDPLAAAKLRQEIHTLVKQSGTTVFLTTHNLHEAQELCDQVAVLRKGKVIAEGAPDEIGRGSAPTLEVRGSGFSASLLAKLRKRADVGGCSPTKEGITIQLKRDTKAAPLVALLVEGGAAVEEVVRPRASLEESFLALLNETEPAGKDGPAQGTAPSGRAKGGKA